MFTFFGCPRTVSSGNHPNDLRRPKKQKKKMCEKLPGENRPKTDLGSQDLVFQEGKERKEEKRKVKKMEEESIPTKS